MKWANSTSTPNISPTNEIQSVKVVKPALAMI